MTVSSGTGLRLDDQLCFALYAASNSVVRAYRPLLAKLGLTYPQYLVMMALWEHDGQAVQDIAGRTDLPANSVTPVVRRLMSAGWVTRHRDRVDGRVVRIRLTAAGTRLEGGAMQAQADVVARTGLSVTAHAALRTALRELAATTNGSPAAVEDPEND